MVAVGGEIFQPALTLRRRSGPSRVSANGGSKTACSSTIKIGSPMNLNSWIRQFHRWVAIAFTVTVIANFIALSRGTPPSWVTYSPLLPLALLLFSGLYLFVLPYAVKWRGGRAAG
jgi:cellulose synthase/poly-beta-1,6-N-acetylglucosamine synthase-like glycosyltransferase